MSKGKENKPHIGIYGRRNNGKSSLINLLTGQSVAIVSDVAGTTTDPVKKSLEITGFGPVILIDTAGIDDIGDLGEKRITKTLETIKHIDLAILVVANNIWGEFEENLIVEFKKTDTPFIVAHGKHDLAPISTELKNSLNNVLGESIVLEVSATNGHGLENLIRAIRLSIPESSYQNPTLLGDLVSYGDIVLLITPIDVEAPAGRLILPQVQTIRDALDNDAIAIVLKEREVDSFLRSTGIKPALAVTDSQIFNKADASIPRDVPLTSFSILLARLKGDFDSYIKGTPHIANLKDGDRILLLESCTHHVSCDDIGRVKIPRWISNFTGKKLEYEVVAGLDKLPRQITDYALVIQCGGCMITRKQIFNRLRPAIDAGIPVTNFGMAIAFVQGIFQRAVEPFTKTVDRGSVYL
jgi:[FeFe] hydrogenase H-cluster maturation GTPase HydF